MLKVRIGQYITQYKEVMSAKSQDSSWYYQYKEVINVKTQDSSCYIQYQEELSSIKKVFVFLLLVIDKLSKSLRAI